MTDDVLDLIVKYFTEIRKKLLIAVVMFLIGAVIGAINYQRILEFFLTVYDLDKINIVYTSPYQSINIAMNSALLSGLLVAVPYLFWQFIAFIKPALSKSEFRIVKKLLPWSVGLGLVGFFFGMWVIQYVIVFYSQATERANISNLWDISDFLGQIIQTGIATSLVFQVPVILVALIRLNIISRQEVAKRRSIIYMLLIFVAVLLPPTDLLSLLLLTAPMILLFESALIITARSK
jgi:sec-independent protein translocase protein TatC